MNAIFKKELRDVLKWTPLGMLLGLVMLWMVIPDRVYEATRMEFKLLSQFGLTAGLVAIGLGLLQSLLDTRNDSRGYLLHRPIEARSIFWGKVAAGFVAYAVCLAVPVVVAMVYLQSKGTEELPTNALQLLPFLVYALAVFLLHPAVIWIANRDARWVGTRLLPAVGLISVLLFLLGMLSQPMFLSLGMLAGACSTLAIATASVILIAARHAFEAQSQLPPRSSKGWRSIAGMIGLTLSAIVLYGGIVVFVALSFTQTRQDHVNYHLSMNSEGQWQQVAVHRSPDWSLTETKVRDIDTPGDFTTVEDDWREAHGSMIVDVTPLNRTKLAQFDYYLSVRSDNVAYGSLALVMHRDRILLYDNRPELTAVVTPEGHFDSMDQASGKFDRLVDIRMLFVASGRGVNTETNPLLCDGSGLHQLLTDGPRVQTLVKGPVKSLVLLLAGDDQPAALWTMTDDKLTKHELRSLDPEVPLPQAESAEIARTFVLSLPPLEVVNSQTFTIAERMRDESWHLLRMPDGDHALVRLDIPTRNAEYSRLSADGGVQRLGETQLPRGSSLGMSEAWVGLAFPPCSVTATALVTKFILRRNSGGGTTSVLLFTLLHAIIAAALAWWLARRWDLSPRERKVWTALGVLGGIGAVLGMRAIYDRPVKEPCPRCDKHRRVDVDTCKHCTKPWDSPPEEGIEIFAV